MSKGIFRLACMSMVSATALMAASGPAYAQQADARRDFNISAQPLSSALIEFSRQSDIVVTAPARLTRSRAAPAVRGSLTPREALQALLAGSGLRYRIGRGGMFIISEGASGEAAAGSAAANDGSADQAGISEILVVGSRSLNADIRRTEDDAQPYVVLTQEDIRNSGATSVDDFLRTRVPMNAQRSSVDQVETFASQAASLNRGAIDLRGLGSTQTLVLVDGRRLPAGGAFFLDQSTIRGIPLAAIERIEVLPSTAGAIYGGSAVGGVINIILKRDYSGIEAQVDYGNTFDGATGDFTASLAGGFRFGSTRINFTASRSRTADLLLADRSDFVRRSRERVLDGNPSAILSPVFPLVAGTPNICGAPATGTARCNGTLLTLDNGTPLNSSVTFVPPGYPGPVAAGDGGAAFLANAGRFNIDAPPSRQALIQGAQVDAAGINVRQPVTSWFELYGDASWDRARGRFEQANVQLNTRLDANDPNNPFQQPIVVTVLFPNLTTVNENEINRLRISGGAIARLPSNWSVSLEHGWSRSRTSSSSESLVAQTGAALLAPFGTRDVAQFPATDFSTLRRDTNIYQPFEVSLINTSLRLAGPVFRLPGGPLSLSMLAERREDEISEILSATIREVPGQAPAASYNLVPSRRQTVHSLYAETRAPIVSRQNSMPLIHELELQAAIRYDRYVTRGTTDQFVLPSPDAPHADPRYFTNRVESVDYLVGGRYAPVNGIMFRASYSTGFLPPNMFQLTPIVNTAPINQVSGGAAARDPKRGGTPLTGDANGNLTITGGGNPDLTPESSDSFSVGLVLEPRFIEGLRLSADYTDIRKTDEIRQLNIQGVIDNEDSLPGRITRRPNLPGDPPGYAGPITGIDFSFVNVARSRVKALDFQVDYRFSAGRLGSFHPYLIATRQTAARQQLVSTNPVISRLGLADGPLRWRANIGLQWSLGEFAVGWNMQYYDSYRICTSTNSAAQCATTVLNQGGERVRDQSYHDLSLRYSSNDDRGLLAGFDVAIGVQNIFNQRPPVIAQPSAVTGTYSTYGDPRLRRFTLSVRKRFGL